MVIEMMGLPGSGKSYLSNFLVTAFRKDGISAINIVEAQRKTVVYKIYWKFLNLIARHNKEYIRRKKRLENIFAVYYNKKSNYNEVNIGIYIERFAFFEYLYKKWGSSSKVYLFDEGILQTLATIMVNFHVALSIIETEIIDLLQNCPAVIYNQISLPDCIESIKKRNRHVCFIDELQGEQLSNFLTGYSRACEKIDEKFHCLKVSREDDIRDNISLIRQFITM